MIVGLHLSTSAEAYSLLRPVVTNNANHEFKEMESINSIKFVLAEINIISKSIGHDLNPCPNRLANRSKMLNSYTISSLSTDPHPAY